MLVYGNYQYLSKKYGDDNFTQTLSIFCERWVNNSREFVEILGDELLQNIKLFKK